MGVKRRSIGTDSDSHEHSSEHPSAAQVEVRDAGRLSEEAAAAAHEHIEKYTTAKLPS